MLQHIDPAKVGEIELCLQNTGSIHRILEAACRGDNRIMVSKVGRDIIAVARQDVGVILNRVEACELMLRLLDHWSDQGWPLHETERFRMRINNELSAQAEREFQPDSMKGPTTGRITSPAPSFQELPKSDAQRNVEKQLLFAARYGISPDQLAKIITKEQAMTKPIKIETKHFINGTDVSTLAPADAWALIGAQERALKDLKAIENQPQSLKDHIAQIEAGIKALVEFLDAQAKSKAA